jgi:hypothetical protein
MTSHLVYKYFDKKAKNITIKINERAKLIILLNYDFNSATTLTAISATTLSTTESATTLSEIKLENYDLNFDIRLIYRRKVHRDSFVALLLKQAALTNQTGLNNLAGQFVKFATQTESYFTGYAINFTNKDTALRLDEADIKDLPEWFLFTLTCAKKMTQSSEILDINDLLKKANNLVNALENTNLI